MLKQGKAQSLVSADVLIVLRVLSDDTGETIQRGPSRMQ